MSDEASEPLTNAPASIRQAFGTWLEYSEQTEILVHITHEGFMRVQRVPEILQIIHGALQDSDPEGIAHAERTATLSKKESEAGFPTLHAHSLLGLWGAFECFVEDLFVAMLEIDSSHLSGAAFSKVKLPVALLEASGHDRCRAILNEATRATDADLAVGVSKFERLLRMVGLGGEVPNAIKSAVFQSQQIRNVWAHRGGVADERFVDRCPNLGYNVGEKVNMGAARFLPLMHGLHMYGVVIFNRYQATRGRDPVLVECVGYEGVLTRPSEGAA